MINYTYICDLCGKKENNDKTEKWKEVQISIDFRVVNINVCETCSSDLYLICKIENRKNYKIKLANFLNKYLMKR